MDAINYATGFQNPMDSFNKSFASGSAVLQNSLLRDQAEAARLAAEAKAKAEADKQAAMNAAMAKLQQPGATYEDYMQASMFLPKDFSEAVQKAASGMKTEERQSALIDTGQVYSSFRSGRVDIAADLLRKQGEAERASGNVKGAEYAEMLAKLSEESPDGAKAVENLIGYNLAALPGGKDAFDAIGKMETERRVASDYPELVKKMKYEIVTYESLIIICRKKRPMDIYNEF
jgi:hypothetical protein